LTVLTFFLVVNFLRKTTTKNIIIFGVVGFVCGFLHLTSVVFLDLTLVIYLGFGYVLNKKKYLKKKLILLILTFILFSLLPLLYFKYLWLIQTNSSVGNIYAINSEAMYSKMDALEPLANLIPAFFLSLGLPFLLFMIGVKRRYDKFKEIELLLFSYFCAVVFFFFFGFKIVSFSRIRVHQVPFFIPVGYFAAIGFMYLKNKFTTEKIKRRLMIAVLVSIFFISSLVYYVKDFSKEFEQFGMSPNFNLAAYPKKTWFEGIVWLKNNGEENQIILSSTRAGLLVPAFASKKYYLADVGHTPEYGLRKGRVESFFKVEMRGDVAKSFLKDIEAKYVFYGDEERSYNGNMLKYDDFLIPVFENGEVVIYKVVLNDKED